MKKDNWLLVCVAILLMLAVLAAAAPAAGRFSNVLTVDEIADFTYMGQDPQADLEARVADVRTSAKRKRLAAALDKLTADEFITAIDAAVAKKEGK